MTFARLHKRLLVITGSPGVGKSFLAKALSGHKDILRIDLHELLESQKGKRLAASQTLSLGYDRSKACYDINLSALEWTLKELLRKHPSKMLVLDTHISHLLPSSLVRLAIVLRCSDFGLLRERLVERGYSKAKVEENLQAEIFDVCEDEAREKGHKVLVIDVSKKPRAKELVQQVFSAAKIV